MRVAIYARYSSENQRDASIADQLRVCREFVQRQGWTVTHEFADHAASGSNIMRAGYQELMALAQRKGVDAVLAESLDRFSRDQEDTAGFFKRLTFADVRIITLTFCARSSMTCGCIGMTTRTVHARSARSTAAWRSRNRRKSFSVGSRTM